MIPFFKIKILNQIPDYKVLVSLTGFTLCTDTKTVQNLLLTIKRRNVAVPTVFTVTPGKWCATLPAMLVNVNPGVLIYRTDPKDK